MNALRDDCTAKEAWNHLEPLKAEAMDRAQRCAELTLPTLLLRDGMNPDKDPVGRLWQSIGAQMVNNLTTRLMLTLFAPSRPFIRMDPGAEFAEAAEAAGVEEGKLRQALGLGEQRIVKGLDKRALRPKLNLILKHLLVCGNVIGHFHESRALIRAISLRYFCVQRDVYGEMMRTVIRERVRKDELPEDMQEVAMRDEVDYFVLIRRTRGDKYEVTHWVDDVVVDARTKEYAEERLPYRVMAWDIADEANYGTSLVSEYEGDFLAVEDASKAMIVAAVLASEFRWLVDPSTGVDPDRMQNSPNGSYMPGQAGQVTLVNAAGEVASAIAAQQQVLTGLINRLGRAFVLASAVIRDSERTTAEEIRQLANEMETGLGGGYSRLAVDLQLPLALFLMRTEKVDLRDYGLERQIDLTVVTGLDALSRSGDLENLRAWLGDINTLNSAPQEVTDPLRLEEIYRDLGTPRGINTEKYIRSADEIAARQEQRAREAAAARGVQIGENAL